LPSFGIAVAGALLLLIVYRVVAAVVSKGARTKPKGT
jgi:hypothetical protein